MIYHILYDPSVRAQSERNSKIWKEPEALPAAPYSNIFQHCIAALHRSIALHCIALHCIALHCIALQIKVGTGACLRGPECEKPDCLLGRWVTGDPPACACLLACLHACMLANLLCVALHCIANQCSEVGHR